MSSGLRAFHKLLKYVCVCVCVCESVSEKERCVFQGTWKKVCGNERMTMCVSGGVYVCVSQRVRKRDVFFQDTWKKVCDNEKMTMCVCGVCPVYVCGVW